MSLTLVYRKPETMSSHLWALLVRAENTILRDPKYKDITFLPSPEIVYTGGKTTELDVKIAQVNHEARALFDILLTKNIPSQGPKGFANGSVNHTFKGPKLSNKNTGWKRKK